MNKEGFAATGHLLVCFQCLCYWKNHDHQWPTPEQKTAWTEDYKRLLGDAGLASKEPNKVKLIGE